jgi:ArsR family transcriptional regulator
MQPDLISMISRRLKAISDPSRIKILALLSLRPACVCELTRALGLSQPAVSKHLKLLENEGFVLGKREKNWIVYSLSPGEESCRQLLDIVLKKAMEDQEMAELSRLFMTLDRRQIMALSHPSAPKGGGP